MTHLYVSPEAFGPMIRNKLAMTSHELAMTSHELAIPIPHDLMMLLLLIHSNDDVASNKSRTSDSDAAFDSASSNE